MWHHGRAHGRGAAPEAAGAGGAATGLPVPGASPQHVIGQLRLGLSVQLTDHHPAAPAPAAAAGRSDNLVSDLPPTTPS